MKPLSLNMSRYRKVAEDTEKSTLQQHDTGHTITIAHKALPREERNYLKALPLYDADKADPVQAHAMAKGGKVNASYGDAIEERGDKEQDAEDENVESNPNYKEQVAQALQSKYVPRGTISAKDAKGEMTGAIKKRAHFASGGDTSNDLPNPVPSDGGTNDSATPPPVVVNVGAPQVPASPATPAPVAATPDTQQQGGVASPQESGDGLSEAQSQLDQATQEPQGTSPETSVQNAQVPKDISFTGGVGQQVKGQLQTAQALGALGAKQALIEEHAAAERGILSKHFEDSMNQLNTERMANMQDVQSGMVDPSKYWDNHSKVATGLGLIIAGFNPTNKPNAALEFLQNNIQRDTQAQMSNLGAKQDLLAHTVQQFGNVRAGAEFANILKTDQIAHQLQAAAAQSQNAQQAGAFNTLAGQLLQSSSQRMIPLAAMQGAMGAMRNGTDPSQILPQLRVAAPEMAKTVEEHLFPSGTAGGGGTTDRPVTPEAAKQVASQSNVLMKTQALQNWIDNNTIGGVLNPAHRGEGEALAAELAQFYRQGTGASTSEAEQKTIQNFINPKPTGFLSAYMEDPKLHALAGSMHDSISAIKSQFGFHPFAGPTSQEAQPQGTPTPESNIQMREGKPYKSMYSPKLKKNVLVPA
jgi:hypothetical protein